MNLVDSTPSPPADVLAHAAELLGVAPPPLVDYDRVAPQLTMPAQSFWSSPRRVRSTVLEGVPLLHPDYRSGLPASLVPQKRNLYRYVYNQGQSHRN